MTKKQYHSIIIAVLLFFMFVLAVVIAMNIKNSTNLRNYLTDSVKSQLISTSLAAREIIDMDAFMTYEDDSVSKTPEYKAILENLRRLAKNVDAKYIYALKKVGDQYVFVFDTDPEDPTIFVSYDLSPVHEAAFSGKNAADIMNVVDEYGSFNTGAVPLYYKGQVVGVVSTDIEDKYLESSYQTAISNSTWLVVILALTMTVMFVAVIRLLNHISDMQDKLRTQALYDTITGLPNRQYLMDHLSRLTAKDAQGNRAPFALFFIDLDNFKQVNDKAGHDAGDELLKSIAKYLDTALENARSFRPSAGMLNIAARVGGDEFIQVVSGVDTEEKAATLAEQLLTGFKTANLSKYVAKFNVGLSIGIALFPKDTQNYHVLIKYADTAMYYAKRGGKNQFRLYQDEMGKES
ncbi:diguanylate cyclase [Desulfovibrio sp. OttesenSCG-928-G15]|nr:diguanylate cyclase [Desulfovibrio sp. OttesenSCG-928-G15]